MRLQMKVHNYPGYLFVSADWTEAEKQHKLNCLRNSSSESICLRI